MRSVVFLRGNIIEGANQNAATHKSRYRYLDALKVYEIITVVFAHCMTYSFDWRETNEFVYYLRYFLTGAISFCIPTFFIVNGFLLFNHTLDCKKHYIKTLKLVILTVVWGVLYLLVLQPIRGETLTVGELIKGLYTLKNGWINFLWYLGALVCIYIFFPILKFAFDSSKKVFAAFTCIGVVFTLGNVVIDHCATIVNGFLPFSNTAGALFGNNWFGMFNPFENTYAFTLVYFCLGGLLAEYKDKITPYINRKNNVLAIVAFVLSVLGLFGIGVLFTNITGKMWIIFWYGFDTVFSFVGNVCLVFLSMSYKKESKLVELISKNTLGIYLVHEIYINLSIAFVRSFGFMNTFIGTAVYTVIVFAASLATVVLLKKVPIVKKLFLG